MWMREPTLVRPGSSAPPCRSPPGASRRRRAPDTCRRSAWSQATSNSDVEAAGTADDPPSRTPHHGAARIDGRCVALVGSITSEGAMPKPMLFDVKRHGELDDQAGLL